MVCGGSERQQAKIRRLLQQIIDLYDGHLSPMLRILGTFAPGIPVRQIAAEARNCHTHLCWCFHHSGKTEPKQAEKAFDHMLRAVIDVYKIAADFLLDLVPGVAPLPAILVKAQAEDVLREIWEAPAHDRWTNGFGEWRMAMNLALTAVAETYEGLPDIFPPASLPEIDSESRQIHDGRFRDLSRALVEFVGLLKM